MKKITLFLLLGFALFSVQSAFATITISGTAPATSANFNVLIPNVQASLNKFQSQSKLVKGFARASIYSSGVVTQRGYQGYDTFAITVGGMVGLQLPSTNADYYSKFGDKLNEEGDMYAGVAVNAPAIQFSYHLTDSLYVGVKFGWISYRYEGWQFRSLTFGIPVSYQLIGQVRLPIGFLVWRGLSIGSGLLYQQNMISYDFKQSTQSLVDGTGTLYIDPSFKIKADTFSWVVPLELTTSFRLLWVLNLTVGAGVDFAISRGRLTYSSIGGTWKIDGANRYDGTLAITGGERSKTRLEAIPKLVAGIGLSIGPVIVDVPVAYYVKGGVQVGVSVGFVW